MRDRDDALKSINSRGSAASCRTNFSSSTGNSSVRSANTAKLTRDRKDNTLGLARANLQNANLERIAKDASAANAKLEHETAALRKRQEESEWKAEDLTRQLQAMEAMMARGMGIPLGQTNIESPGRTLLQRVNKRLQDPKLKPLAPTFKMRMKGQGPLNVAGGPLC